VQVNVGNSVMALRIMPVGDSITRGTYLKTYIDGPYNGQAIGLPNPVNGGWRKILQDKLRSANVCFEFVGELNYHAFGNDGIIDPTFQPHHHGLAGFGNKNILSGGIVPTPQDVLDANNVKEISVPDITTAIKKHQPDIILLMSGANGFNADARDVLIKTISKTFQGYLFVASITPQKPPRDGYENVLSYNRSLPDFISSLQQDGINANFVDMYSALSYDDITNDGVHPNANGMTKIAETWFAALKRVVLVTLNKLEMNNE
jgi:lysophospholipase L1-like esterase